MVRRKKELGVKANKLKAIEVHAAVY